MNLFYPLKSNRMFCLLFALIPVFATAQNAPTITSFSPTSAPTDSTVAIQGSNFTGATAVSFGGVPAASFRVASADLIYAVVGSGASGNVIVVTPVGADTLAGFTYIAPPPPVPVIVSFSPTIAGTDSTVVIQGANFTGATAVSFGDVSAASFHVVSDSTITAVVGTGASGNVQVTTSLGTGSLGGFGYMASPSAPVVASLHPFSGSTDSTIVIVGSGFTGASTVSFGGTPAASFRVVSATEIDAVVGTGATGAVDVTTPGGSGSLDGFTFIGPPAFSLSSFTGSLVNDGAQLSWQVKNDQGIAYYEIDAGQDSSSLTKLADQNARGSASESYSFVDPTLSTGANYFQLRIVDTIGNASYSGIVDVILPENANVVKVSPNPAKGVANVTLPISTNTSTVQIMDLNGNVYFGATVAPNTAQVKVDFSQASGGIFIMSWSDGTRKLTKKIMVIN